MIKSFVLIISLLTVCSPLLSMWQSDAFVEGNYEDAILLSQGAVRRDPLTSMLARTLLLKSFLATGQFHRGDSHVRWIGKHIRRGGASVVRIQVDALLQVGQFYFYTGNLYMAENTHKKIAQFSKATSEQSAMNDACLARIAAIEGELDKFESYLKKSERKLKQTQGSPSSMLGGGATLKLEIHHLLSDLYALSGEEKASLEHLTQALAYASEYFGAHHFQTVMCELKLYLIKNRFKQQVAVSEAERTLQKAAVLKYQPKNLLAAKALLKAHLAYQQQQFEKATTAFQEAMVLFEQLLPSHHTQHVDVNLGLARCLLALKRPSEALPHVNVALKNMAHRSKSLYYAQVLELKAEILQATGQSAEASRLSSEAQGLYRSLLGDSYSSSNQSLLAELETHQLLADRGHLEPKAEQVKALFERMLETFGENDRNTVRSRWHLAQLLFEEKQIPAALEQIDILLGFHATEALDKWEQNKILHLQALCFAEQQDWASGIKALETSMSYEFRHLNHVFSISNERDKSFQILDLNRRIRTTIEVFQPGFIDHPELLSLCFAMDVQRMGIVFDALIREQQAVNALPPEQQEKLRELKRVSSQLAQLGQSLEQGKEMRLPGASLKALSDQKVRLQREIQVNIRVTYPKLQPLRQLLVKPLEGRHGFLRISRFGKDSNRLGAFVLDFSGNLSFVDLGVADLMDSKIQELLQTIVYKEPDNYLRSARELGVAFSFLDGIRKPGGTLYVMGEGVFEQFPLELLQVSNKPLVSQGPVSYLTTIFQTASEKVPSRALVGFVNPEFGDKESHHQFKPLPGTTWELQQIYEKQAASTVILTGSYASEGLIKLLQSPRVLHIGSHGYKSDPDASSGAFADLYAEYWTSENAMIDHGVALAGVNEGGQGSEDGILSALEILDLDLAGTELVTLNLCRSGVGESFSGEGQYGLRRAFMLAGAKHVLASSWSVPDDFMEPLVSRFYDAYLSGSSPASALHVALSSRLKEAGEAGELLPLQWSGLMHFQNGLLEFSASDP